MFLGGVETIQFDSHAGDDDGAERQSRAVGGAIDASCVCVERIASCSLFVRCGGACKGWR